MDEKVKIAGYLDSMPLSDWRYYPSIGSTNDDALAWSAAGADDWSLVLADEQTAGRGRGKRHWVTQAGTALALSVVVRPSTDETAHFTRFTALAALALVRTLADLGLQSEIKWPNDILVNGRKTAGVLVEADWRGEKVEGVVIGMGVNITPNAVPEQAQLRYPATSVVDALGSEVDRWEILAVILREMKALRGVLVTEQFVEEWNQHLAFRNQWVQFQASGADPQKVKISGVLPNGKLDLTDEHGQAYEAVSGEILMAYN